MKRPPSTVCSPAPTAQVLGTAARQLLGIAFLGLLALGAITAPGCGSGGHGKYTDDHYNAAKEKMGALKSGTEYQMAHQAFLAGDLQKADRHVNYSIELNERVPRSHVLRGRIMMEMGNLEQANISFKKAESIDEKNVDAQYFQGVLAERLMRPEEALARYQKASELDPANSQYPVAAAEMYIQLDRAAEAETYLTQSRDRFDHSPGIRQTLGHLAMLRNDPKAAEQFFFEASLLAPNDQPILEDLAHAQMANGKFAEADTTIAKLLTKTGNAGRRDLKHLRGTCHTQLNRPVDARQIYLDLTTDDQGQADYQAWLGLARMSVTLRDMPRLRESANRLVVIDQTRTEGFVLRALHQRKMGDLENARASLGQALSIRVETDSLVLLGLIERDMGHTENARAAFAQALKIDPGNADAQQLYDTAGTFAGAGTTE